MNWLRRFWRWYWPPHRRLVDWQALVDDLDLAGEIAGLRRWHWRAEYRYAAQVVANFYYAVVLAGNVDPDAIDGELFALDAELAASPDKGEPRP